MPYASNPFNEYEHGPFSPPVNAPFNRIPVFSTMGRGPRGEKGDKGEPSTIDGDEIYTKDETYSKDEVYSKNEVDKKTSLWIPADKIIESDVTQAFIYGINNDYGTDIFMPYKVDPRGDEVLINDIHRWGYKNKNGDLLMPYLPKTFIQGSCNNPIPSLLNAMSYIGEENVHYKTDYKSAADAGLSTEGLNNHLVSDIDLDQDAEEENDRYASGMHCGDFGMMYLAGIPYNLSWFEGVPNIRTQFSASLPNDIKSYLDGEAVRSLWNTRDIVYNAYTTGNYAYSTNENVSVFQPGDVILGVKFGDSAKYAFELNHCMIVVDVEPIMNKLVILESAVTVGGTSWSYTKQGGGTVNGVHMNRIPVGIYDAYFIFRPSFNSFNDYIKTSYTKAFHNFTLDNSDTQHGSHRLLIATSDDVLETDFMKKNSIVVCEIESNTFIDLFEKYPNILSMTCNVQYNGKQIVRNVWGPSYFDANINPKNHMPKYIRFVGMTLEELQDISSATFALSFKSGAPLTSVTFDDFSFRLTFYERQIHQY